MACRGSGVRVPSAPRVSPLEPKVPAGFFVVPSLPAGLDPGALHRRPDFAPTGSGVVCPVAGAWGRPGSKLLPADWRPAEKCITLVRLLRGIRPEGTKVRGCGAAGSAPAWHAGGQGFESPQLHQYRKEREPSPGDGSLSCCQRQLFVERNSSGAGQSAVQLWLRAHRPASGLLSSKAAAAGRADEEVTDVPRRWFRLQPER